MDSKKDSKKINQRLEEENNKLKLELEKTKKEKDEYKNKYLRALADYQNYEKRVSKEKDALRQNASRDFLLKLLPVIDDLLKAEIFVKDSGLKLVGDKF